ncbi:MAG: cysteine peptidase family C39 domain-containing protein [Nanoarchaeota archaeon]
MLKIRPVKQITSHCGPATLQMVFDYYGKHFNGKEIAKVAETTNEEGTSYLQMIKAIKFFGFKVSYKEKSSFKEIHKLVINKKIPVIINWFSEYDGHYSVVIGVDNKNIYFIDPEYGKKTKMSLKIFERVWFGINGNFFRSKEDLRIRPIIIVKN